MTVLRDEYRYLAPWLMCHKDTYHSIPLPYPNIPEINLDELLSRVDGGPLILPSDEWSVLFGCRECGHVDKYFGWHVIEKLMAKPNQGKYHNDATCFCAEFPCARLDCKAPTKLHVDMPGGTEADVRKLLRSSFFLGKLPCGHAIDVVPESKYMIYRITSCLWPLQDCS